MSKKKREPKEKNLYGVHSKIWVKYSEDERMYFNKFFSYIYFKKEWFEEEKLEYLDWEKLCINMARRATDVYRRTKHVNPWRRV